jgi:hypothetical protein
MEADNNSKISNEPVISKRKYVKKPKVDIQLPKAEGIEDSNEEPMEVKESIKLAIEEKPKRGQSEKTKAALAKGREKLAELNKQRKAEREALVNEKINKKADRIAEQKVKMLKDLNLDEEDSDEDIVAKPVKPKIAQEPTATAVIKKKKAPRVVYVEEEESEEEEVVYRSRAAPKKKVTTATPGFSGIQFY